MQKDKKRVAITGFGIISSLGNNSIEVMDALQKQKSGVELVSEWKAMGLKSFVAGTIKGFDQNIVRREIGAKSRYMDENSLYCALAAREAIHMSGLPEEVLSSENTSCIAGNGLSSTDPIIRAGLKVNGHRSSIMPYDINRSMSSSCSANLAYYLGVKGRSYSISSACTTSLHNIGHSYELISSGLSEVAITGGAEEISPAIASLFNGMRGALAVMPEGGDPSAVSRPYDLERNGFVLSGGGGMVVLEELEQAQSRGAKIYGEIVGYGVSSDGHDIIQPHPEGDGAYRCMSIALKNAGMEASELDYINTHGTSTVQGDIAEAKAISRLTGNANVPFSSTKSLSGHGIGAAGVHELIYCLLMLNHNFLVGSANIRQLDPAFEGLHILAQNKQTDLQTIMTNNFGFGGTNASMILRKHNAN